jgi:hypothetical protein
MRSKALIASSGLSIAVAVRRNTMLNVIDKLISYLVSAVGVLFVGLTPIYAGDFVSRSGVEYLGAVLFLVFLGLFNLARIKSGHGSVRRLAICANVIALVYLVLAYSVIGDPAAIGVGVLVLVVCFTSWMNRTQRASAPSAP